MGEMKVVTLMDACREVMASPDMGAKYPKGMDGADILSEIRKKHPDSFPLVSALDVINEMTAFFGPGKRAGLSHES